MQITALKQGIKDKERVNLFVDGSFKIAIDKATLTQEMLFVGKVVDKTFLEKLKNLDTYNLITRKLISWTASRPRSSREIADKIKMIVNNRNSNSFNNQIDTNLLIEHVVNKLKDFDITDSKFGIWLIENRHSQGKYGKQRIQSELVSKGLSSSLAKELLNEHYIEDTNIAIKLLEKKFGVVSVKDIKDPKLKSKAYRFLITKGFKVI